MSRKSYSSATLLSRRQTLRYAPLAVALGFAISSHAASIVVDSAGAGSETGQCTIVDAVTALNTQTTVNGCVVGADTADTIDLTGFTVPTTISLTQVAPLTSHALALSQKATISGALSGGTPLVTIERSSVTGTADFGLIQSGYALTINGLTLSNGSAGAYLGGAILSSGGLILNDCVISNNKSDSGGGGIAATGQLQVNHSIVTGNTAGNAGGGIESNASTAIYYSTVSNNSTLGATASSNGGGGVFASSSLRIRNTLLTGNTSAAGGGGVYGAGIVNIIGSTISNNTAQSGSGGGVFTMSSGVGVSGSTINGNHATGDGGGVHGGAVDLTNSTLTGNTATGLGGGVATDTLTTSYSTLASNTATGAGGGANFATGADAQGTIFYGNTPDDLATTSTAALSGEFNLIGMTAVTTTSPAISCNPMLAPLADNGGPTQTMALQTGSCAIDAASNQPSETDDQRGLPRPAIAATNADIGAYEFGAIDPDKIFADGFGG